LVGKGGRKNGKENVEFEVVKASENEKKSGTAEGRGMPEC
jgi:hypothetical protein